MARAAADIKVGGAAGLELAIGRLADVVGHLDHSMRRAESRIPSFPDFAGSGTFPASGNLLIVPNPYGPPQGFLWHVKTVMAAGGAATASPAGTVFMLTGMVPANANAGDFGGSLVDRTATSMPVAAFYDDGQFTVVYPNMVYFIVTGGTSTTVITISGTAKQVPEHGPGSFTYHQA